MIDFDFPGFGTRVAYYRKLNGMSGTELADKAGNGITRAVLANIETGRKGDISLRRAIALSVALEVPVTALMYDVRRPSTPTGADLAFEVGEDGAIRAREMRSFEFASWLGGAERVWTRQTASPARREVHEIMSVLAGYHSSYKALIAKVSRLRTDSARKADGTDWDLEDDQWHTSNRMSTHADVERLEALKDRFEALGIAWPSPGDQLIENARVVIGEVNWPLYEELPESDNGEHSEAP